MFPKLGFCFLTLTLSAIAAPTTPFELQQAVIRQANLDERRAAKQEQESRRRTFEAKYNQLIQAVSEFSKSYNQGKGAVWPKAEADKLSRAIRQLQSAEKSLNHPPPPVSTR